MAGDLVEREEWDAMYAPKAAALGGLRQGTKPDCSCGRSRFHMARASQRKRAILGSVGGSIFRAAVAVLCLATPAAAVGDAGVSLGGDALAVGILVLNEHGVGSASLAQPYLDRMVSIVAAQNRWGAARGQYCTSRSTAEAFIRSQAPHYGILSLAAFLAMRESYRLEVIGTVEISMVGGQQYHVISQDAPNLDACRGRTLATNHADDLRFVNRVVLAGRSKLADFTLVETQRPLLTIKKVLTGEAECALIDDAQLAELSHIEGAEGVRSIWDSPKLPPMVVVAFPAAPRAERQEFRQNLPHVCDGDGQSV
jgi:hypothetical protein